MATEQARYMEGKIYKCTGCAFMMEQAPYHECGECQQIYTKCPGCGRINKIINLAEMRRMVSHSSEVLSKKRRTTSRPGQSKRKQELAKVTSFAEELGIDISHLQKG